MLRIRAKAVCVLATPSSYAFALGKDPTGPREFLIPFGGGIEFGESSRAAAIREVREELGISIADPRFLGVLENVFTWNGTPGHEIVFCYLANLPEGALPASGNESDGTTIPVRLVPRMALHASPLPIYPDGLIPLLTQ